MADKQREQDLDSLGPWEDDNKLGETAQSSGGVGSDVGVPFKTRFIAGVAKLIQRRQAITKTVTSADPKRPAVFLLHPDGVPTHPKHTQKRIPMLNNGLTEVCGRVWFVNAVVVSGKYIDIKDDDDEMLFGTINDELLLGDVPAIVLDPRVEPPDVRYYPSGLADMDNCHEVKITSDVSIDCIFAAIDRVYKSCLVTPEAQVRAGKLWADDKKCWPASNAEDIVQLNLKAGLTETFPSCSIRHEQTGVSGRSDLEIEEPNFSNPGEVTRHAVLELKILRSFRESGTTVSPKETLDWVESGLDQAGSYRDERNAKHAALCCFDMRKEDTGESCFDHIATQASSRNVHLRRWYIFATSKKYRKKKAS